MTPESDMKKEVKAYLKSKGAYVVPVANGAYAKMGDPDMVVCYKGIFIAIEGKTYEGRQSDWQKLRMEQVQKAGGIYAIIHSVDGARQLIEELDRRHPDEDEG